MSNKMYKMLGVVENHENVMKNYFQRELRAANRGCRGHIGTLYPQGTRISGVDLMIEFPSQSSTISQPGGGGGGGGNHRKN